MKMLKRGLLFLVAFLLFLVLVEGLCSWGLFTYNLVTRSSRSRAERGQVCFDEELGWAHEPATVIRDLYGPGLHVTLDGQGFRAVRDVPREIPPGRIRVLCSGDSFTFGYGVGDEAAWPAVLDGLEERLETVNLGVIGYGLDQIYLRYRRHASRFEHQIHLVAVIPDSFGRMRHTSYLGFGKPTLRREGDTLAVDGVPVARAPFVWPWLTQNQHLIQDLRAVQLARRIGGAAAPEAGQDMAEVMEVALAALEDLHRSGREKSRHLVVVFLPRRGDYTFHHLDEARAYLLEQLADRGILTLDMVAEFRALPESKREAYFLRAGHDIYPGSEGHYSPEGNRFVAGKILEALKGFPTLAPLFRGE